MHDKNKREYTAKLKFWKLNNFTFLLVSVVCLFFWGESLFFRCWELDNISIALIPAFLIPSLAEFVSNVWKYDIEKRKINSICKSIIDLSVILIKDINEHLIKTNGHMIENTDDINPEKLTNLDFNRFKMAEDLLKLISNKFSQLNHMKFLDKTDTFSYMVEKTTGSIQKSIEDKDIKQAYVELRIVINTIGTIKPPLHEVDYIETFNNKLDKYNKALKDYLCSYTNDYIVMSLENELLEKMHG